MSDRNHQSSASCDQSSTDEQLAIFRQDVLNGLSAEQKHLPCKYFYDERGSALFDDICELDEYYLTRAELAIMEEHADSIARQIGREAMLVEYGSGSSVKTRILLDALEAPVAYVPIDISEEHLLKTAEGLMAAYPEIEILPLVADFTKPFELPISEKTASHIALYFPGSTIGNFTPQQAGELLRIMSQTLGKQGGLLIGIDLQKSAQVIEAAYDDAEGVTADFNLNLLTRINSELDGDFALDQFAHQAVYDEQNHRVEISIVSQADQAVAVGEHEFDFRAGEAIHTEYSHKYSIDGFAELAGKFGFRLHKYWTDDREYFAVLHLVLDE